MNHERLEYLLNRFLDNKLGPDEQLELERELLHSATARRQYWELASLHGWIREAAVLKWSEKSEYASPSVAVVTPGREVSTSSEPEFVGIRWWLPWLAGKWKVALAFSLGLALVGGILSLAVREFGHVATIGLTQNLAWGDAHDSIAEGTRLRRGSVVLARGAVQIQFDNGAQVVMQAPARFDLLSSRRLECHEGRFWVFAPAEASGFTLVAQGLEVTDLGTEFGLITKDADPVEVHVFTGSVALRGSNAGEAIDRNLKENEAIRVNATQVTQIPPSREGFLDQDELAARLAPAVQSKFDLWRRLNRQLASDPSALLHFTFQDVPYGSQTVSNEVALEGGPILGTIQGCAWTEGRWPGKSAMAFTGPEDRVRVHLPQRFEAFTAFTWVRVDGLPNSFVHSLITGDSEEPGTVRWTIHHDGSIRFGLANESAGPEAAWAVGSSAPAITGEYLGRWVLLALVYDGEVAIHYRDGQPVWSGRVRGPKELSFGWMEVGNWVATPSHPDFQWAKSRGDRFFTRQFIGRMDELGIFTRAMTAEEIEALYQAGRPLSDKSVASVRSGDSEP